MQWETNGNFPASVFGFATVCRARPVCMSASGIRCVSVLNLSTLKAVPGYSRLFKPDLVIRPYERLISPTSRSHFATRSASKVSCLCFHMLPLPFFALCAQQKTATITLATFSSMPATVGMSRADGMTTGSRVITPCAAIQSELHSHSRTRDV